MTAFWKACNQKSQGILTILYAKEQGCLPDFYYKLKGEVREPDIINAPLATEEEEIETAREMETNSDIKTRLE